MADPCEQYAERIVKILVARGDDKYFSEALRTRIHEHVAAFSQTTSWFHGGNLTSRQLELWLPNVPRKLLEPLIADCDQFYSQLVREAQAVEDVYETYTSLRRRLVVIMNAARWEHPGLAAELRRRVEAVDPDGRELRCYESNAEQQSIYFLGELEEVLDWMDGIWECLTEVQPSLPDKSHLSLLISLALKL
jgi:hypothetical protein